MARPKSRTLTELELQIMQVVWELGEVTVDRIRKRLKKDGRALALPSIRTMLGILQEKGFVTRQRDSRSYVYRATVGAEQAQKSILKDVIERVFDGSASGLVAALVTQDMVGKEDLAQARKLIQQHERRKKK
jgi:BlaI family transcriptional regulator, penicillinase repressor